MRPLVRILKHLLLAVALIVGGLCVLEVGLRAQRLQGVLNGRARSDEGSLVRPCPLAFQHLPPGFVGSHRSEADGALIEVRTNSLGLRSHEVAVPKPAGHYRIVCLGDDAALAPDIETEQTFCNLLQQILEPDFGSPVEVINAAQPGHCPLLSLAWARARLVGLQPDLVILCCDVSDVGDDRRCRPLANFDEHGTLLSVTHPAAGGRPEDWLGAVEQEFLLAKMAGDYLGERFALRSAPSGLDPDQNETAADDVETTSAPPAALVELTWEPLTEINAFCRQISAELVVVVVPSAETVRSAETTTSSHVPDRVGEILRSLGERANRERIPLLDASSEFARQGSRTRLFLRSSGSLAAEGHRLYADILAHALLDRRAGSSSPQTLPVGSAVPADPAPARPLPTLERRPRASDQSVGGLR